MQRRRTETTEEYSYTVLYEPAPREKGYQVTVPLLPGLVTYGRSFEEAREMVRDAIRCYLEALRKERARIPIERSILQERMTVAI